MVFPLTMLQKGTTLAGYRIDGVLGQGGMGAVYEATQLSLDRVVALKLLASHLSDDVGFRERFRREGQIQARLEHPHIVTVYEAGETEHGLFIAMRLVRGRTLKDMIVARELDAGRTLRILEPVAEALDDAHAIGLIHRDIKPQNMLVGGRDHAFLADFGLTKATTESSLTKTGYFLGTLDYVSPEQVKGERATAASDIYSLAGVLYECLTGVVPYPKESEAAVLYAHVMDPPPRLTDQRPELPEHLDAVVMRAMAKDPADRHSSATELIAEVGRSFTRRTRAALKPPGPIEAPEETGLRRAEERVTTHERPRPTPDPPRRSTGAETVVAHEDLDGSPAGQRSEPAQVATATPSATALAAGSGLATAPAVTVPSAPAARRRPRSSAIGLIGAGALAVVLVTGFLVGKASSGDEPAPEPGATVSGGDLSVQPPAGWARSEQAARIPGLAVEDPITLRPGSGATGSVTVGTTDATGPSLLPASLRARLDGGLPAPDAVELGDLEALRYAALRPEGLRGGPLRLYAVPTTSGVATVACAPPSGSAAEFLSDCDRVAGSLELRSGEAFALGRDEGYEKALGETIGDLNAARRKGMGELRRARRPAAQARAAGGIARAYRSGAASLRRATSNPQVAGANARVVAALRRGARGYSRLAAAARRGSSAAYADARREIARADAELRRSLLAVAAPAQGAGGGP